MAEPAFSPSGDHIAYTLSVNHQKHDKGTSDIWSVPWSGGKPAQLTRTPKSSEWLPRFSADGNSLLFLSDAGKDEITQLWRMSAKGGRARRVTNIPGGISDFDVSPDGKRAVVLAEVGRHVGSEAETPPPIETERFLFKRDGAGYLDDRTQQLFIIDLATGKSRQLTSGERDHWAPAWSPDGKLIAYAAKDRGATDRDSNYELFAQGVDAGEPRKISTFAGADNDPDWAARASWSPDSRRVLWLEGGDDKWIYYAAPRLAVADGSTEKSRAPRARSLVLTIPSSRRTVPSRVIEQDRDTWLSRITGDKIEYLTSGQRFATTVAVAPMDAEALPKTDVNTPCGNFRHGLAAPAHASQCMDRATVSAVKSGTFVPQW